jgi:hypothetical protein
MKRKALLTITGCPTKAFETYSFRGFLPFTIEDGNWSDYTIENAFSLKVLMDAAANTDLSSASALAQGALDKLLPIDPFAYSGDEELWVALVRYEWPEAPEGWSFRHVTAGRWSDINESARKFVAQLGATARITGILSVSATKIANQLLTEAREFGLPEGDPHSVPDDLSGSPEWFKVAEMARRELFSSGSSRSN